MSIALEQCLLKTYRRKTCMGKEKRKEGGAIKSIKTGLSPAKGPVKRTTKNKQIFLKHCCKRVE